jgi:hypothetical protein
MHYDGGCSESFAEILFTLTVVDLVLTAHAKLSCVRIASSAVLQCTGWQRCWRSHTAEAVLHRLAIDGVLKNSG